MTSSPSLITASSLPPRGGASVSRRAVRPFRARLERPQVTKTGEFSNVISVETRSATLNNDDALGIHPHADRTIGERGRHAVAIAIQMDQACRRHALGVFDEAVERARKLHQSPDFFCPYVDDRAGLRAVQRLGPQFPAARLQPVVQRRQGGEVGHGLPEPMASVLDVLLDLPLLPPGGWIAELGLE